MAQRVRAGKAARGGGAAKRFDAWSFSRWRDYDTCPRLARFRHLDKVPEPSDEERGPDHPLVRGTRVHGEAEGYLKTPRTKLPKSLASLAEEFRRLRAARTRSEISLGFDRAWKVVGFFARDVWLRMKIDALSVDDAAEVRVTDFKTGRYRAEDENNQLQLDLYSVSGLQAYPKAKRATSELWYVDHGLVVDGGVLLRRDLAAAAKRWEERVEPMFADKRFSPKPGPACRWCAFARSKGGPCDLG